MSGRRKNEIQVEWLNSKDVGKVNAINVKHVLEERQKIVLGAEITVKFNAKRYKAVVRDLLEWEQPQRKRGAQPR
jgi:hypothetical protein